MEQYVSKRNIDFTLKEVHKVSDVLKFNYYSMHNEESFDFMLDAAKQIGDNLLFPMAVDMDKNEPDFKDGKIIVHPHVENILKELGESGWIGAIAPQSLGGMQLPQMVWCAANMIFQSANNGAVLYHGLTIGSANLIISFGSDELKQTYLPHMLAGKWQGTMCLTEADAGSSLSDIKSTAEANADGSYKIKGQKIFISAGDHQFAENVVHLYLAKIKGGPEGAKGISLFVVPKYRIENGKLVDNDCKPGSIFHKMGQKASPAVHIVCGEENNCKGWLVGEAHNGLGYMFQMMNEARIGVGLTGAGTASAAYYASLNYANERPQGRIISDKDMSKSQTLIINHADIKRMLLFQKSVVEGSFSLVMECAKLADIAHAAEGEEKETAKLLLEILTPVVKTFPTEYGVQSVSQGMQVLGGSGYCEDFPLERLYRDVRILPIYEGTTGIQSMDLLGRKMMMKGGKAAQLLLGEITKTVKEAAAIEKLQPFAEQLGQQLESFQKVVMHLGGIAMKGEVEKFMADATVFMEYSGLTIISWQWLKQGVVASRALENCSASEKLFYESKLHTLNYFFNYELTKTKGLQLTLFKEKNVTVGMDKELLM